MSNFNITQESIIIVKNILTLGTIDDSMRSQLLSEMSVPTTADLHQFTPNTSTLLTATLTEVVALVNDVKNKDLTPDLVDTFTISSVEFTKIPIDSNYDSDTCQNALEDAWTVIIFLNSNPEVHGLMFHDYVDNTNLDGYKPSTGEFIIIPGQSKYRHIFNDTKQLTAYLTIRLKSSLNFTVVQPLNSLEIDAFIQKMIEDM